MPNYTFRCGRCRKDFEVFMSIANYNPTQNCPTCTKTDKVFRNYAKDNVTGRVETRTLGALADKQADRTSDDEKHHMWHKHNAYRLKPKPELPEGMSRINRESPFSEQPRRKKPRRKLLEK